MKQQQQQFIQLKNKRPPPHYALSNITESLQKVEFVVQHRNLESGSDWRRYYSVPCAVFKCRLNTLEQSQAN